jgi:hypothetical protein
MLDNIYLIDLLREKDLLRANNFNYINLLKY